MGKTRMDRNEERGDHPDDILAGLPYPTVKAISEPGVTYAVRPGRLVSSQDPPDFTVYRGQDHGWVLRDHAAGKDYPFHSREAALAGAPKRVTNPRAFIGALSAASVYGEPAEGIVKVYT